MEKLSAVDPASIGGIRLFRLIGTGGFGRVYLGQDSLGHWVAVKTLRPEAHSVEGLSRFAREARAMARTDSLFLAGMREISISSDPPFIVSEYMPGPTLSEAVVTPGGFTPAEIESTAIGLAAALSTLADAGVTHRDVKPANIIVGPDGPALVDLGIARSADETAITSIGAAAGTPMWMSPEQVFGGEVSPASDVWAWSKVVSWLSEKSPEAALPEPLATLVAEAQAKDPESRPTAAQIVMQLAPDGAEVGMARSWGRLGGYAVGRRDAIVEELSHPVTMVDPVGASPTQAAWSVPPTTIEANPTPLPTPVPIYVQATGQQRSQAPIVVAIVVVGLLAIAGIAAAVYLLNPSARPSADPVVVPQPNPTVVVTQAPADPVPAATVTATATATQTEVRTETPTTLGEPPSVPVPTSETAIVQQLMDYMNTGNWSAIPSLCNPQSVCSTQLVNFFQRRFESGQFVTGSVGPLRPCYSVPTSWLPGCDGPDTWLAQFSWTCSKGGTLGTQTEVGKLIFDYSNGVRIAWFDGTSNTPRVSASQCQ